MSAKGDGGKRLCRRCREPFTPRKHNPDQQYCGLVCSNAASRPDNSGENHPQWKGGVSWDSVREGALERDSYECRFCGTTNDEHLEEHDRGLEAHHVIPQRHGGEDTLENLITVCQSCHRTLENTHAKAIAQMTSEAGL